MLFIPPDTRHDTAASFEESVSIGFIDLRCQMVERKLAAARPRLLRLALLLGVGPDGVEDVVQETLLEAWRSRDALHSFERFNAWLDGICRNICRRWLRAQGVRAAHYQSLPVNVPPSATIEDAQAHIVDNVPDPEMSDLAESLTKQDLSSLLDRALAYLHPSTRQGLILRYIADQPLHEVAAQLGLSVGTLEVRLHRARKELREVLRGPLREEAESFDIQLDLADRGRVSGRIRHQTRIWCPFCGKRHLEAEIDWRTDKSHYWCPTCGHLAGARRPDLLAGVSSYKPILTRILRYLTTYYMRGLEAGEVECDCGHMVRVEVRQQEGASEDLHSQPELSIRCTACGTIDVTDVSRLSLDRPETQRFWQTHPRMRLLPARALEMQGIPALLMPVESVTDGARMEIVWARSSLQVLAVYGSDLE
jgi:RNA polymerase sigma factor (sigma-70 family)